MKKYLLCVGIDNYPIPATILKGAKNDAKDWHNLLINNYDFEKRDNDLLLGSEANRDCFRTAFQQLISDLKEGDFGVFIFSGHGRTFPDKFPIEEADKFDEAILLYDKVIRDDSLRKMISKLNTKANLVMILDCCFSGGIIDRVNDFSRLNQSNDSGKVLRSGIPRFVKDSNYDQIMKLIPGKRFLVSNKKPNELIFTAASDQLPGAIARERYFENQYNGVLSYHLIQILKSSKQKINYSDLYRKLLIELQDINEQQEPQFIEGGNFINQLIFEPIKKIS